MCKMIRLFFVLLVIAATSAGAAHAAELIKAVRLDAGANPARLVLDLSGPVKYTTFSMSNPERLVIDVRNAQMRAKLADVALAGTPVKRPRSGIRNGTDIRIVLETTGAVTANTALLTNRGVQLAIDLVPRGGKPLATSSRECPPSTNASVKANVRDSAASPSKPTMTSSSGGTRDVIIAIDAGHGGNDPGAIGHGRLQEKRVVLAIAQEVARLLERERGYKAVLTRKGDYFLPLKQRRDL